MAFFAENRISRIFLFKLEHFQKKKLEKSKCENGKEEFYQRLYEKKHDQVDQV